MSVSPAGSATPTDRTRVVRHQAGEATRVAQPPSVRPALRIYDRATHGTHVDAQPQRLPLTLGRRSDNDLQFADPTVSAAHARILRRGGTLVLEDLGSKNGTWIGGRRVERRQLLARNYVRFGAAEVVIEVPGGQRTWLRRSLLATGVAGWSLVIWLVTVQMLHISSRPDKAVVGSPVWRLQAGPATAPTAVPTPRAAKTTQAGIEVDRSAVRARTPVTNAPSSSAQPAPESEARGSSQTAARRPVEIPDAATANPPAAPEPDPAKQLAAAIASGVQENIAAALAACPSCPRSMRATGEVLLAEIRDLAELELVLRQLARWPSGYVFDVDAHVDLQARLAQRLDALLTPLLDAGAAPRVARLVDRFAARGVQLPRNAKTRAALRKTAHARLTQARAIERVNPERAEALYREALERLPADASMRTRIRRRLED